MTFGQITYWLRAFIRETFIRTYMPGNEELLKHSTWLSGVLTSVVVLNVIAPLNMIKK